uniref:Uncharacterized protein At2g10880 n=1 Tax=Arabidopsis thaliana TaxID=3702 RepID=Q9SHW7_ARATH|nr:hypothetical protein [Arabidopsis thaliana]
MAEYHHHHSLDQSLYHQVEYYNHHPLDQSLYHMVESLIIIHSTSLLDCQLQSLLHSALNQTLEHKQEKKTPAYHSTIHSTTWVEYRS